MDIENIYSWERQGASWESQVHEDSEGNLVVVTSNVDKDRSHRAKERRITSSIRRGLIRYFVVAFDSSSNSMETDFRPNRLDAIKDGIRQFILEYFDQNPISQLSLAVTRNRIAEKLTDLSGNPKYHENRLGVEEAAGGDASIQNVIHLALNVLSHIPEYGTKELLIVYNSLKTRDPGNIFDTISEAKRLKLRVNIICLAAEVYICKKIAEETGGSFAVAKDTIHLQELILAHALPPPELKSRSDLTTDLVYVGFPRYTLQEAVLLAVDGIHPAFVASSYECPRCCTRCTELPTQCHVCRLQLSSASHIARSYHHLFPVPNYIEFVMQESNGTLHLVRVSSPPPITRKIFVNEGGSGGNGEGAAGEASVEDILAKLPSPVPILCRGCDSSFVKDSLVFVCSHCIQLFCIDCDLFIHDSLHNCPGC